MMYWTIDPEKGWQFCFRIWGRLYPIVGPGHFRTMGLCRMQSESSESNSLAHRLGYVRFCVVVRHTMLSFFYRSKFCFLLLLMQCETVACTIKCIFFISVLSLGYFYGRWL